MFYQKGTENHKRTHCRILRLRHEFLADFSEESLFEGTDRIYSKVHVELPYPIHQPLKTSEDLVLKLLKEKEAYHDSLKRKQHRYNKFDKNKIEKQQYDGHQYIFLPRYLTELYNERDPDNEFEGDYNYYYTGGNLEKFQFNNNDYLIRPDVDNNLYVNKISNYEDIIDNVTKVNYKTESTIFNINSAITSDGLYFILREKNRVSAVKCNDIDNVTLKYSHLHKHSLLDAKFSEDMKLGMTYSTGKFAIKDFDTSKTIFSFKNDLKEQVDNFQQFRFLDDNTVILMDRSRIKMIDIRNKKETMCFDPKLLYCNSFCNLNILDNTLLLTSRHYVLKTDIRKFEDIYHYTHMLYDVPCYMDYALKDNDTYLVVSGQHYDSKVLFTGKAPYSLPFKIPTLKETLEETILKHPSLSLDSYLKPKLLYSLTGLKVVEINDEICIFTSNCMGEIFKQNVCETKPDNDKSIKMMQQWCKTIEKPEPVVYLTNYEDVSDIRFSLDQPIAPQSIPSFAKPGKRERFLKKFESMYSLKNIKSELAKDFLSIWEDSEDEDNDIGDLPEEETLHKVESWIQMHKFEEGEL